MNDEGVKNLITHVLVDAYKAYTNMLDRKEYKIISAFYDINDVERFINGRIVSVYCDLLELNVDTYRDAFRKVREKYGRG